jgi:uncharacterized protein YjaZ
MLDVIIGEGKKMYFTEKMLPKTSKANIIEYTPEQYQWCLENEFQIWSFFIEQDLLYSTDDLIYQRYVAPAPSSAKMPPESPGQTGVWLGWQIVTAYMAKNKNVSLAQLMAQADAQKIMNDSGYKPNP